MPALEALELLTFLWGESKINKLLERTTYSLRGCLIWKVMLQRNSWEKNDTLGKNEVKIAVDLNRWRTSSRRSSALGKFQTKSSEQKALGQPLPKTKSKRTLLRGTICLRLVTITTKKTSKRKARYKSRNIYGLQQIKINLKLKGSQVKVLGNKVIQYISQITSCLRTKTCSRKLANQVLI